MPYLSNIRSTKLGSRKVLKDILKLTEQIKTHITKQNFNIQ